MVVSADTSFLFSLYANDVHTPRALAWTKKNPRPIFLSVLAEYELGNALRFAEFRKGIAAGNAAIFWAQFVADQKQGRIRVQISNLADVVGEAARLSASHTLAGGHRGFDILHVAAALQMTATTFLTFDANQKKLAKAEGLDAPIGIS